MLDKKFRVNGIKIKNSEAVESLPLHISLNTPLDIEDLNFEIRLLIEEQLLLKSRDYTGEFEDFEEISDEDSYYILFHKKEEIVLPSETKFIQYMEKIRISKTLTKRNSLGWFKDNTINSFCLAYLFFTTILSKKYYALARVDFEENVVSTDFKIKEHDSFSIYNFQQKLQESKESFHYLVYMPEDEDIPCHKIMKTDDKVSFMEQVFIIHSKIKKINLSDEELKVVKMLEHLEVVDIRKEHLILDCNTIEMHFSGLKDDKLIEAVYFLEQNKLTTSFEL